MKQKVGDKVKVTLYPSGGLGGELKLVQARAPAWSTR